MTSKKGYIYAELDVTDSDYFNREYAPRVEPVLKKFDARFLVSGGSPEVREGERRVKRVVLLEFPSPELAQEFYDSREYQEVIAYRLKSARTHLYLLEGTEHGGAAVLQ
ncbi:DUF1330 domain-containing protein [Burkholderia sp. Ax-1719]|uniref:DUF1330 domain-containing protein n=1 Tax=Burkholderia sp. Ax-1719 TaxID=2608334 RepID=UPI001421F9C0|nr:DUF1330 domain-containing protein [Burkholderia sp. Ax-1719]NIE63106.1 DUF1330 domain-containing protein [Burkholderia sp. Ax-1719]